MGSDEIEVSILYKPVGQQEMELIGSEGFEWIPSDFSNPFQSEERAKKIAERWNEEDGRPSFVVRFYVEIDFVNKLQIEDEEYKIPDEEWENLNNAIVGAIEVIKVFDASQTQKAEE